MRVSFRYQSDPYLRTITTFVKRLANSTSPRAAAVFNRGAVAINVTVTRAQMRCGIAIIRASMASCWPGQKVPHYTKVAAVLCFLYRFNTGTCACVDLRDVDAHAAVASGVTADALITLEVQPHQVVVVRATCCAAVATK